MSPFFIQAIQLFLSLSILIILHELGHFIPAKIFKTKVEKFFLFFDVKFALFKKKIGDTVYGIGWLPLGGYVKISGMIDESMDKEQMAQPPKPWEFRSKPAWQRLIIMLGGVTVNIILGFVIYMMVLFVWGSQELKNEDVPNGFAVADVLEEYGFRDGDRVLAINGKEIDNILTASTKLKINVHLMMRDVETVTVLHQDGTTEVINIPEDIGSTLFAAGAIFPFTPMPSKVIDSVMPDTPAARAGLEPGDEFLAVNGEEIETWADFQEYKKENLDEELSLKVKNGSQVREVNVEPNAEGIIGIYTEFERYEPREKEYSVAESFSEGFEYGYWTLHDYVAQFKYVFTKKGATQVGGFGAIGSLFPDDWDWHRFWTTTALISIILAFMNILPIPALDGGHVMFLLYEMISGRKPNEKFMEYAQMIGFFLLIALVLYANGNDIYRWLFK